MKMPTYHNHPPSSEEIERRALERDLIGRLSPDKKTRQKNRNKANQLRQLLDRIKRRTRDK
jgi:hypothetical protein